MSKSCTSSDRNKWGSGRKVRLCCVDLWITVLSTALGKRVHIEYLYEHIEYLYERIEYTCEYTPAPVDECVQHCYPVVGRAHKKSDVHEGDRS